MFMRKSSIRAYLLLAGVTVALSLFCAPTRAMADFKLEYSVDGAPFTVIDNGSNFISVTIDGLTVQGTGSASTSTAMSSGDLGVSGTSAAAHTIVVLTWFSPVITQPPPQTFTYAMTGSLLPFSAGSSIVMQDWVNSDIVTAFGKAGDLLNTHPQSPPASGSGGFSDSSSYSVTQQTTIVVTAATSISSDSNYAITTAPAPAGIFLVLSGAPLLGVAQLLRRRKVVI